MVGTGVFVSIGIAAGIAGPAVMLAIAIAACVAACNAFSSAQLAANHPVSGGTYEYGYEYLGAQFGFTAGWMYLAAKSASAATAALGFAGYLLGALGGPTAWVVPVALGAIVLLTGIVLSGIRRSNGANMAIVSVTLATLAYFVLGGLTTTVSADGAAQFFDPFFAPAPDSGPLASLLHASALMFVAFTGYGRIATLGEEVQHPKRTIPRAIVVTMIVVTVLYIGVAATGVAVLGADGLGAATDAASPLEAAVQALALPGGTAVITIGACTAMLGVLLNLLLGLSRVLLAMGRRGDMPEATTRLNAARTTPTVAVLTIGALIFGLALIGDVRTTWTFSAFTVLIYYALTNLSALQLAPEHRLYPRAVSWGGLVGCMGLAFWVEPTVWATGLALIAVGLLWHAVAQR
jgi:APA family basic amino acid/polyamine antiporter